MGPRLNLSLSIAISILKENRTSSVEGADFDLKWWLLKVNLEATVRLIWLTIQHPGKVSNPSKKLSKIGENGFFSFGFA